MTVGKGLLIGAGVLAGGYVLYQLFGKAQPNVPRPSTSVNSAGSFINGLVSVLGGIASPTPTGATGVGSGTQFWSSPSEQAANGNNPYIVSTPVGGYTAGAASNYAYADSHPGTALPDGVYGPPVPATGLVAPSSAGDFNSTDSVYA
ncbi:MAG TPA: hypothetical protein VE261_06890 [Gaiellaceae bacterium]|nr:hypothetical protein [Gaiellaceae bacterium]